MVTIKFRQKTSMVRRGVFGRERPVTSYSVLAFRPGVLGTPEQVYESAPCASRHDALQLFRREFNEEGPSRVNYTIEVPA